MSGSTTKVFALPRNRRGGPVRGADPDGRNRIDRSDLLDDYTSRADLSLGSVEIDLDGAAAKVVVYLTPKG